MMFTETRERIFVMEVKYKKYLISALLHLLDKNSEMLKFSEVLFCQNLVIDHNPHIKSYSFPEVTVITELNNYSCLSIIVKQKKIYMNSFTKNKGKQHLFDFNFSEYCQCAFKIYFWTVRTKILCSEKISIPCPLESVNNYYSAHVVLWYYNLPCDICGVCVFVFIMCIIVCFPEDGPPVFLQKNGRQRQILNVFLDHTPPYLLCLSLKFF